MKPIILCCGASASGKSTLVERFEELYGLKAIPSYTTRKPRYENEKGHTFITEEEFDKLEDILAYAETTGSRYAVTKQMFEDEQYSFYVIDNSGIKYLEEHYDGERPWHVVYITAPLRQRYVRMVRRPIDDPVGFALERIEHDAVEFKDVPYDIKIENADGNYNEAFAALFLYCKQKGVI